MLASRQALPAHKVSPRHKHITAVPVQAVRRQCLSNPVEPERLRRRAKLCNGLLRNPQDSTTELLAFYEDGLDHTKVHCYCQTHTCSFTHRFGARGICNSITPSMQPHQALSDRELVLRSLRGELSALSLTSAPYEYEKIDNPLSSIRILALLPSRDDTASLRGRLTVETDPPDYEALSYARGTCRTSSCLRIGNKQLPISANLDEVLRTLRQPSRSRNLWIDAVCIDQHSNEEKNVQVQQMYKIYSRAARVLIWLGTGNEKTDQAMELLQGDWQALSLEFAKHVCERPWWGRVWSVHEALAANASSLVICGNKEVPWRRMQSAIIQLVVVRRYSLDLPELGLFNNISTHRERNITTLEDLVYASATRKCFDPRDHIYALLGLVQVKPQPLFDPDYAKPVSWAYQKATAYISQQRRDLKFIALRAWQSTILQPSWCFDFSNKEILQPSARSSIRDGTFDSYFASSGQEHRYSFNHDAARGTIEVSGVIVGKITEVLQVPLDTQDKEEGGTDTHRNLKTLVDAVDAFTDTCRSLWTQLANPYSATSKIIAGGVWRIVAGAGHTKDTELWDAISGAADHYRSLVQLADRGFAPGTTDRSMPRFASARARRLARKFVGKKCFFATDSDYPGSASPSIQQGDIVCILFGCKVPLVLRECGDGTHSIVSGAYVHDLMTGGYFYHVTEESPVNRPVVTFTIC